MTAYPWSVHLPLLRLTRYDPTIHMYRVAGVGATEQMGLPSKHSDPLSWPPFKHSELLSWPPATMCCTKEIRFNIVNFIIT
jgi:hypothetical protein